MRSTGLLRVKVPPENWFVPLGSNRSGGGGNAAVGASGVEGSGLHHRLEFEDAVAEWKHPTIGAISNPYIACGDKSLRSKDILSSRALGGRQPVSAAQRSHLMKASQFGRKAGSQTTWFQNYEAFLHYFNLRKAIPFRRVSRENESRRLATTPFRLKSKGRTGICLRAAGSG